MNEKLLEKFIDFLEEYIDEEIVKDERYKELRKKCSDLSHGKDGKEYQKANEMADYCYRRLIYEKLLLCFKDFAWVLGG